MSSKSSILYSIIEFYIICLFLQSSGSYFVFVSSCGEIDMSIFNICRYGV